MKWSAVLRERLDEMRAEKAARDRGEDPKTYLRTGFREFDERGAIERSILTVIGAPTGEGKSIFKRHLQEYNAMCGYHCLDLSFEDPPARSADRSLSCLTDINNAKMLKGLDEKELAQIALAVTDAEEWADNIEYEYGLKRVEQAFDLITKDYGTPLDLVQVDYAQAFPASEDKTLERTIADFAWSLGEWAQATGAAVIIYSQLKPQVEARGVERAESSRRYGDKDKGVDIEGFRPFGPGDLAWATALGTYAKGLGFLFRPNRYRRRYHENVKDDRMDLIWPKRNFSGEGTVTVGFDGRYARLYDLVK